MLPWGRDLEDLDKGLKERLKEGLPSLAQYRGMKACGTV